MDFFYQIYSFIATVFSHGNLWSFVLIFFPFVILLELPFNLMIILYAVKGWLRINTQPDVRLSFHPLVTIIVSACNESQEELEMTLRSAREQIYPGWIEIIFIIDSALDNPDTVSHLHRLIAKYPSTSDRKIRIIEKKTRGGHASSMNLGLRVAKGSVLILLDADTSIDNTAVSTIAPHFFDDNVIAVSGSLRVRNYSYSWLTKLQAVEYMNGIQLGRFGLTEVGVTNNISGAFGVFRTSFLKRIGGWLNGTAEDLDLVMRLHAYNVRYPNLKIVAEPDAVAWTAAPTTMKKLFIQRLRWDGDLYYIYIRRHWRNFSSKIMGGKRTFLMAWYALYSQLILPFILVFYYGYLFSIHSVATVIAISILVYIYYLVMSVFMFFTYLLLVSERPRQDAKLTGWVLLTPFYQQILRILAVLFLLNEILFKGHQDTSMAPWWVIRKIK